MAEYNFEKSDQDVINECRDFFTKASESESENRENMLEDLEFLYGEQWPDDVRKEREIYHRPCLTVNQLPQFIRQVTNDQRHNRPGIVVDPSGNGADEVTAEMLTGLIRHILNISNADVAIDTAYFNACSIGIGYMRVLTDYESYNSFNQEIYVKRVLNPFSVYFGNYSSEHDYSDLNQCIIVEDIVKDDYIAMYGKDATSWEELSATGNSSGSWINGETVRIAEYFRKVHKDDKLLMLNNGITILESQFKKRGPLPPGLEVVNKRDTKVCHIEWYKTNGKDVLDKKEWPGMYIPVIPVVGEEYDIDGKRHIKGMVRDAKDSQRMYNFWATAQTEMIALSPKAPWLVADGQIEGYEEIWRTANTDNVPYLPYNPQSSNGKDVPPPQRIQYEPPVQAISQARSQSAYDLKAVMGMYGASIGEQSNEVSGKAIRARQMEGDMGNYHRVDNLSRSMRYLGKILVDLIPKIYDTQRIVRIIDENDEPKTVTINGENEVKGIKQIFDPSVGNYDVVINVGPSYTTKRQEAIESMMSLTNSFPQLTKVAGDLLVKNMDWPGAKEIAERLKKTIPPELAGDEEEEMPPRAIAQMQQMGQQIEMIGAQAQEMSVKLQEQELELKDKDAMIKELQMKLNDKSRELDIKEQEILIKKELEDRKLDIDEAEALTKAFGVAKKA